MNKMACNTDPAETDLRISAFLLERYHIGEVTLEEKQFVEKELSGNSVLADSLAELDRNDRYFRSRFPHEHFFFFSGIHNVQRFGPQNRRIFRVAAWTACAAAVALIAFIPWFIMQDIALPEYGERVKGTAGSSYSAELSVYLKDEQGSAVGSKLTDQAVVRAGNTIQLAYRLTETVSGEKYGVIFSIDGRSSVTMHYPYSYGESTRLSAGNAFPLAEAYTLDDAPDYEIFFFVVDDVPLNVPDVLSAAERIAPRIAKKPQRALRQGTAAFKHCELQIITLQKE